MGAPVMIVIDVARKQPLEVTLIENNDVIGDLSAKAGDQSFDIRVLPRRSRRRDDFVDTQTSDASLNLLTINAVSVSQQITWRAGEGKRAHKLLRRPSRRGMFGDIEVQNSAPIVREHDKHEEHSKVDRGHDKEIDSHKVFDMLIEERLPC